MPQGNGDSKGGPPSNHDVSVDTGALTDFARAIYTVYREEIEPLARKAKAKLQGQEAIDEGRRGGSANSVVTLGANGAQYYGSIVGRDHAMYAMNATSYVELLTEGYKAAAYGTAAFAKDLKNVDADNAASIDGRGRQRFDPLSNHIGGDKTGTGRGSNPDTLQGKNADGASSTETMTEQEIIAIVEDDYGQVPRMREQAEGWKHVKALATTISDTFKSNRETHLGGESWTLEYVRGQIKVMESGAQDAADAAGGNSTAMTMNADEAERVKKRIDQLKGDAATLDGMTPEERAEVQKMQPADGESVTFADMRGSVTEDMRHEMGKADGVYRESYVSHMGSTPAYEGLPRWEGPQDFGVEDENSSGYGGNYGDDGSLFSGGTYGGTPTSNGQAASPDDNSSSGPELQTGPAPATTGPGPVAGGGAPPPPAGGGPLPPTTLPGGSTPNTKFGGGPVRTVTPPGGGRTVTGPSARPTPGMTVRSLPGGGMNGTRPGTAGVPGRGGVGGSTGRAGAGGRTGATSPGQGGRGRMASGPNKNERAMLPNQRSAARNAKDKAAKRRGGEATEDLFSQRKKTVRPVIGKRLIETATTARAPKAVLAEGKVFGARPNKAARDQQLNRPAIAKSTLARNGIVSSRDGVKQWTNQPGRATGKVTQGNVFGERSSKSPKPAASKLRELRRQRISNQRTEALSTWRERKGLADERPVTEGLHDTVVPPVIKPRVPGDQVTRADTGPVFGPRGWERH